MAMFIAVANRKGGVGKSTISTMLAYALSIWSDKRVLLIDLDAQSNSSLILLGGARWIETQRKSKNIAAYIEDRLERMTNIRDYLVENVGDIETDDGKRPKLSLLAGSLEFEDIQDEMIAHYSRHNTNFRQAKLRCAEHFRAALNFANSLADIVILDCAPGLSTATAAALKIADKVVVPFRPDAVSEFAVDRIAQVVENRKLEQIFEIPPPERRYVCVANQVRPGGRDALYVDTISGNHPMVATQMPALPDIADAFDFVDEDPQTMAEKYGEGLGPLQALHRDLATILKL